MREITTAYGELFEVRSLADVMAMAPEQLDAEAYRRLIDRQWTALAALHLGDCSPGCLASPDRYGPCDCVCGGRFHAHLWGTDVVPSGDWGETWVVYWSSRDRIRRDSDWGAAQDADRRARFGSRDEAERFAAALGRLLADSDVEPHISAFPLVEPNDKGERP